MLRPYRGKEDVQAPPCQEAIASWILSAPSVGMGYTRRNRVS
ncbi:hypothetical protein [Limnospira indica]|uniref:Uncharacterized protein n=1 Tax=Limnospira indica PCC 8005 TaxID=376219 RepID=A0A9P1P0S3_9CYAN|nr:hypothetical protein [Limnospira indica]CDM97212.1 protein of unknown function [Limnospira indica PCC 8005]